MSAYLQCSHCEGDVTPDSDFCPHCGIMFERADEVACDNHPDRKSVGVCIICHALLCTECAVVVEQRVFCHDHQGVPVQQDWAVIFSSTEVEESELRRAVLEAGGYKVQVQNFQSVGYAWGGGGDSPISRSNLGRPALVLVPIPEFLEAVRTLEAWESEEPTANSSMPEGVGDEDP